VRSAIISVLALDPRLQFIRDGLLLDLYAFNVFFLQDG